MRREEPPVVLDDLDARILRVLNRDARLSYREIAREVEVAIGTVSARLRRLESTGIIHGYVPLLDQKRLGYDIMAVVGIKISRGRLLEVQRRLAKEERVFGVYDVTGEWDSILMARFKNTRELDAFIKRLAATENVESTYTQVVLNVVKQDARVPV